MKLGPFKEEQTSVIPYSVVFHDLLSNKEMTFLKEESKPHLSRNRTFGNLHSGAINQHQIKSGERRRIIHKTVQAWLQEVDWPLLTKVEDHVGANYLKMNYPILWKLDKKISLATQLRTDLHSSGTYMQVTNYGLGGLCEHHIGRYSCSLLLKFYQQHWGAVKFFPLAMLFSSI